MLSGASNKTPNLNRIKTKELCVWQCRKWRLGQPAVGPGATVSTRSQAVFVPPPHTHTHFVLALSSAE